MPFWIATNLELQLRAESATRPPYPGVSALGDWGGVVVVLEHSCTSCNRLV